MAGETATAVGGTHATGMHSCYKCFSGAIHIIFEKHHTTWMGLSGLFTPSDSVTNVTLTGRVGMEPILPITVPVKKIKNAARQRLSDADRVALCKQAFRLESSWFTLNSAFRNRNLIHLV